MSTLPMKMPSHTPSGLARDFPRKPSGNSPPAVGSTKPHLSGVTIRSRKRSRRPISGMASSLTTTARRTALSARLRWVLLLQMAMVFTTWPATFGNGVRIGTASIFTCGGLARESSKTPRAPKNPSIHASLTASHASLVGAHSSAMTAIARAIGPAALRLGVTVGE